MLLSISAMKLTLEERVLFMKASKARFLIYRNAWKNLMDQQSDNEIELPREIIEKYIMQYEYDIKKYCQEIDQFLEGLLQNSNENDFHEIIFYKKLRADYLRYFSEVSNQDEFSNCVEVCEESYRIAYDMCKEKLTPHDTLTLSLALNYSIFAYFILDDTKKAFDIADNATKEADKSSYKLNNYDDKEYKMIYKDLEENLTIWKIELFDVN